MKLHCEVVARYVHMYVQAIAAYVATYNWLVAELYTYVHNYNGFYGTILGMYV